MRGTGIPYRGKHATRAVAQLGVTGSPACVGDDAAQIVPCKRDAIGVAPYRLSPCACGEVLYPSSRPYGITSQRRDQPRQVYRVLRSAHGLMTAYEILDAVRPKGISAPPTVYRALNRLMREGRAHRVESRNAYVACSDPRHRHDTAIFAICRDCGHIDEMHEGEFVQSLVKKLSKRRFVVDRATIEIQGLCGLCAGSEQAG
ncbi:MAG: transcriptional repressor [Alphaproteobacteria bacterium]|nr:MAG: transcriptional repressor [Alphaproteobacteria bacterium]